MVNHSRENTTENVYFNGYDLSGKIEDVIYKLKETLLKVPAEFRDSAELHVAAMDDYGSPTLDVSFSYKRPETDDEYRMRLAKLKFKEDIQRDRERAEFERLKAKFE